jgi:hypothetical protein
MSNRIKAQNFIISYIDKLLPNSNNKEIYTKLFSNMTDEEFDKFISDLETGKKFLTIIAPNFDNSSLTLENNLKVADELNHDFFEQLWIEGDNDTPTYLTPNKYLVVDLPVRRASQMLIKKIFVPDHNKSVDSITMQPTGESKGAKISYPELQVTASMGLEDTLVELMKYRGGDVRGNTAYNMLLSKYGKVTLNTLSKYQSGVESTKSLKTLLTCLHLKSTL